MTIPRKLEISLLVAGIIVAVLLIGRVMLNNYLDFISGGSGDPALEPFHSPRCDAIDDRTLQCGDRRLRLIGVKAGGPGGDAQARKGVLAHLADGKLGIIPAKAGSDGVLTGIVVDDADRILNCSMISAGATYDPGTDFEDFVLRNCLKQLKLEERKQ